MNRVSEADASKCKAQGVSASTLKRLRRFLFAGWAVSLLGGLGSCAASLLVPDPNPYSSMSTENGMEKWKSLEKEYVDNQARPGWHAQTPDWCVQESVPGDGEYSELKCYIPTEKKSGSYAYDVIHCTHPYHLPFDCNQAERVTFTQHERGKLMRFYGDTELLTEEKVLRDLSGRTSQIGMILFWLASPSFAALWILISITKNKLKM